MTIILPCVCVCVCMQSFLGAILDTLLYQLNDALSRLANVKTCEVAKDCKFVRVCIEFVCVCTLNLYVCELEHFVCA